MIEIRRAKMEDIPRIMSFIDEHWKKGHIMARNRKLFEFQHVENDEVYYIIAEDITERKIYACMGYIPMNHLEYPVISTMMIRALKHKECDMLGEEMNRYMERSIAASNQVSPGIKKRYALAVDGIEEGHIGKLKHYYRLAQRKEYKIAKISNIIIPQVDGKSTLKQIKDFKEFKDKISESSLQKYNPYRDLQYIKHRYFEHPYYKYMFYQIFNKESVLVVRENKVHNAKVLRVIDYFGRDEDLAEIGLAIDNLLIEGNYEYIDFYCYGIDNSIMQKAGFVVTNENDINIIPNFFEPFEQKDKDLYFYTWFMDGLHVFKGFGDQDRPNQI